MQLNKLISGFVFLSIVALIGYDAMPHFDEDLVHLKRGHRSAQRDWNVHYDQSYVFNDSSMRYQTDLNAIEAIIEPDHIVLSDLATSYFLAAHLPIYAKNVHPHQGRNQSVAWRQFLNDKTACYLGQDGNMLKFRRFVKNQNNRANKNKTPLFKYVVVNKDIKNLNLKYGCLWHARGRLSDAMAEISSLRYAGEFLDLYELNDPLVETQ